MTDDVSDPGAIDDVLSRLARAKTGERSLDCLIAVCLRSLDGESSSAGRVILDEVLANQDFSLDIVGELLNGAVPPYTTALDATLPDENVVLVMYSAKRDLWAAVHKAADDKEFLVWGANEILARRMAALKAWRGEQQGRGDPPAAERPQRLDIDAADRSHLRLLNEPNGKADEEDEEWAILF